MKTDRNIKTRSMPVTGISSLIVIFAVLCLILLSVLAISTVKADEAFADKSASSVKEYYQAESEAEEILALLRQGTTPEKVVYKGVSSSGYDIYHYTCRVNDTQILKAEVEIKGSEYNILRWQTVSDAEWNADESLDVWDGE